jgi:hypothetical protein
MHLHNRNNRPRISLLIRSLKTPDGYVLENTRKDYISKFGNNYSKDPEALKRINRDLVRVAVVRRLMLKKEVADLVDLGVVLIEIGSK